MSMIHFLAPAKEEMNASARFYEQQLPGLGHRFLDEVDRGIRAIREHPESAPAIHSEIRRKLIRHFPFALLYRITPAGIVILAVMHQHRRPDYWKGRT
jgi:plasmid stabilization system protein ParE